MWSSYSMGSNFTFTSISWCKQRKTNCKLCKYKVGNHADFVCLWKIRFKLLLWSDCQGKNLWHTVVNYAILWLLTTPPWFEMLFISCSFRVTSKTRNCVCWKEPFCGKLMQYCNWVAEMWCPVICYCDGLQHILLNTVLPFYQDNDNDSGDYYYSNQSSNQSNLCIRYKLCIRCWKKNSRCNRGFHK